METSTATWQVVDRQDLTVLARQFDRKPQHGTRHLRWEAFILPP